MATSSEYRDFLLGQLAGLEGLSCRPMMGEYILYYQGRIFGGLYDDRLLVKNTPAARALLLPAELELPYPGGSPMLRVDEVDTPAFLCALVEAMLPELPAPKPKKKKAK